MILCNDIQSINIQYNTTPISTYMIYSVGMIIISQSLNEFMESTHFPAFNA